MPAYLDYNATAPVKPAVKSAMVAAIDVVGNPSSVHGYGRVARAILEESRQAIADAFMHPASGIVLVSGGTEANAMAMRGAPVQRHLVSAIEHDSVLAQPDVVRVPVTRAGVIDLAALSALMKEDRRPTLLTLMHVNNETGVIQPVAEAAAIMHAHGGLLHCDAVQSAGRVPFRMAETGADMLSLSAHKIGGPKGAGALLVREGLAITPLLRGGLQEMRLRGGTQNLPGIAGMGAAVRLLSEDLERQRVLAVWRDTLAARLTAEAPEAIVFGNEAPRVSNTLCLSMPGVDSATQVMSLDLAGVAVSAGAACSSGTVKRSHVVAAMGYPPEAAESALRISLGWATVAADVDACAAAWIELYRRMRGKTMARMQA